MNKLLSLLGLARRAGRLEAGFDACRAAAREGRAALLQAAQDHSPHTYKKIQDESERAGNSAARAPAGMVELGRACGVRAGVVSVNDKGFAQALQKEMEHTDRMKEDAAI